MVVLSSEPAPGTGKVLVEADEAGQRSRDEAPRLDGKKPESPEEEVQLAIGAGLEGDLRQEIVDGDLQRLCNAIEGTDAGWMDSTFVPAEHIGPDGGLSGEVSLSQ